MQVRKTEILPACCFAASEQRYNIPEKTNCDKISDQLEEQGTPLIEGENWCNSAMLFAGRQHRKVLRKKQKKLIHRVEYIFILFIQITHFNEIILWFNNNRNAVSHI